MNTPHDKTIMNFFFKFYNLLFVIYFKSFKVPCFDYAFSTIMYYFPKNLNPLFKRFAIFIIIVY